MICLSPKYLSVYAHKSVNFTIWLRLESLQHTLTEKGFTNGQKLSGFSHGNLSTQVFNIIKAMTRLFWKLFFSTCNHLKHWCFSSLAWRKTITERYKKFYITGNNFVHTHLLSSMQEHNSSLLPGPFAQKWTSKKWKHKYSLVNRITEHPENLTGPGNPTYLRH